jgi:hypothetical protein
MTKKLKYPFNERLKSYRLYEEVDFLQDYISDRQEPGADELITTLSAVDAALTDTLRLLYDRKVEEIASRYAFDRMTNRYAIKHLEWIQEKVSMIDIELLGLFDNFDSSPEALTPVLEPTFMKLWRRSHTGRK